MTVSSPTREETGLQNEKTGRQTTRFNEKERQKEMSCEKALMVIKNGVPAAWNGFPDDCTLDDVKAAFDKLNGPGTLRLSNVSTEVYVAQEQVGELRIWMDEDNVKMVEVNYQVPLDTNAIGLGTPDAKKDVFYRYDELKDGEWIYAKQGLTLIVSGESVLRALFYCPTSVEEYSNHYRPSYRQIRKPLRPTPSF